MNDQLYEILNKLSRGDLIVFAKSKKLDIPNNSSKEQIISILDATIPEELKDQVRNAVRLELSSTESNLLNLIGEKTGELKNDINVHADKLQGVNMIKWLYGFIGTIMGLMVCFGSIYGFLQLRDLSTEIRTTKTHNDALKNAFQIYRDYSINQQLDDIKKFMDDFTHELPKEIQFETVIKHRGSLAELQKNSEALESQKKSGGYKKLKLVTSFLNDLNKIKKIRSISEPKNKKVAINSAISEIDEYKNKIENDDTVIAKKFGSYYENILGVLYYNLYKYSGTNFKNIKDLTKAKKHFSNAMKKNITYARVYHNRAALCYEEYYALTTTPNRKKEIIEEGKGFMSETDKCPQSPRTKSTMYNNLAAFFLLEAHLFEKENIKLAKNALTKAHNNVVRALKTNDVNPGAYITQAEIESYYIHIFNTHLTMSKAEKEKKVKEISECIRLSLVNGYSLNTTINKSNFFNSLPDLKYLENLCIDYKKSIFIAANL